MDQGFAPQGFSTTDAAKGARHVAAHLPHGSSVKAPTTLETAAKGAISINNGHAVGKKLTAEEQQVERLQGIKSKFMMPATLEIIGMLGGGALGWVTSKLGWQRATAAIGMVLKAPVQALRETSLSKIFHLPAKVLKAASSEAANAGNEVGNKAAGWADAAARGSTALTKTAEGMEARAVSFAAPLRTAAGNGIASFEKTRVGEGLHGAFDKLMHNRKAAALAKHDVVFAKAQTALTTQASSGWKESVGNFFSRTFKGAKPATVPAGELSHIVDGLHAAKGNHGELKKLASTLEEFAKKDGIPAEVKARASNAMKHVGRLVGSANAMETYGSAAGGSMKTMAKAMVGALGRVPVFHALLAVGVTAGVGAAIVSAKSESTQAKAAFADLSSQLGNSNSGFLQAVKKAQKSQGFSGKAKAGLKVADELVNGAMWMLPGGGGVAMMGAMMVPQLCNSLVPGNPLLGAYVALQKNDAGEIQLAPDGKVEAIRHLVAAMPAVEAKGGFYNRLAQPIAAEMVSRNLNTQQIVQLLGNDNEFTKLASEVAAKRAEQPKVPVANDHVAPKVNASVETAAHPAAIHAQSAMSAAETAYHQSDKPSLKVAANDAAHAGTMSVQQRHVG